MAHMFGPPVSEAAAAGEGGSLAYPTKKLARNTLWMCFVFEQTSAVGLAP